MYGKMYFIAYINNLYYLCCAGATGVFFSFRLKEFLRFYNAQKIRVERVFPDVPRG